MVIIYKRTTISATSCYECHEVDNPKNCTNVVECPSKDHVSAFKIFISQKDWYEVS